MLPTTVPTPVLAAATTPARSDTLSISGGVTGGAITILTLIMSVWLVAHMVKKDKLKITHTIAVVLTVIVALLTPMGQLGFHTAMNALNNLGAIKA